MKKFLATIMITLIGIVVPVAKSGQEDPYGKPFAKWTKADAEKILNDSPWARSQTVRIRAERKLRRVAGAPVDMSSGSPTVPSAELGGAEAPIDFIFTLRLRSSQRIREGLVRLKQIEAGYDKMSPEKRAQFDAQPKIKGLLSCPACEQNYVVTLSAKSTESPGADAVFNTFKGGRLADLQRYVFLGNNRGVRRNLIHFVPPNAPGEEALFFFSRFDDRGQPLLTPDDTELIVNFTNTEVNMNTNFRIDVRSLVVNGQLDF